MITLKASELVMSDWVKLYNKRVIMSANCTYFPEFNNQHCIIKSVKRSKSNSDLFIVSVIIETKTGKTRKLDIDSGMRDLVIKIV